MEEKTLALEQHLITAFAHYAKNTQKTYFTCCNDFFCKCGKDCKSVDCDDIVGYFANKQISEKSKNLTLNAISRFFEYLQESDESIINPVEKYRSLQRTRPRRRLARVEKRLPPTLTENEEARLLALFPLETAHTWPAQRTAMLLRVLLGTGLRVSEAVGLVLDNLVLGDTRPFLQVLGKGGLERQIPLSQSLILALQQFLQQREQALCRGKFLFCNKYGAPLNPRAVYNLIRRCFESLDIQKSQMGPHVLRHTFITRQFQHGIPPAVIKAWAGHRDLAVTLKIYEHVSSGSFGIAPV